MILSTNFIKYVFQFFPGYANMPTVNLLIHLSWRYNYYRHGLLTQNYIMVEGKN